MNNMIDEQLIAQKEARLNKILGSFENALVAFSGGVDSSFLLFKTMSLLGSKKVIAATGDSVLRPEEEIARARLIGTRLKVKHSIVKTAELTLDNFYTNPPQRCYYCKKELYGKLNDLAYEYGIKTVLDGTITEDEAEYRPGLRAAMEFGVVSPLRDVLMTKAEIRFLSRKYGLITWDKPAATCLATRFPYGEKLERDKIERVDMAERALRKIGFAGDLRVRSHGELARIEVGPQEMPRLLEKQKEIIKKLRGLGFDYITLDLGGFKSGSMDLNLPHK
ncbi:MAG: ATP-dependent sacrificial sulfur transferase LarE [Dethiobacteria bacterium]